MDNEGSSKGCFWAYCRLALHANWDLEHLDIQNVSTAPRMSAIVPQCTSWHIFCLFCPIVSLNFTTFHNISRRSLIQLIFLLTTSASFMLVIDLHKPRIGYSTIYSNLLFFVFWLFNESSAQHLPECLFTGVVRYPSQSGVTVYVSDSCLYYTVN